MIVLIYQQIRVIFNISYRKDLSYYRGLLVHSNASSAPYKPGVIKHPITKT